MARDFPPILFLSLFGCICWASQTSNGPLQLIYPDREHQNLLINEESLKVLESITQPLSVVSSPLHSGKSYLANQLMGKTSGFALGPSIEPKTRGLWMAGPIVTKDKAIVYLDTEGLFASNVSEVYDAKIFSISALLSSYLLYNTVRFIDQSAIEYIEAQLFALRTELKMGTTTEFQFPPLVWVVQNFFQDTVGMTPQQWLLTLIRATKKNKEAKTSLLEVFPSVDCHTMFLPHQSKDKMKYLDKVEMSELHKEYLRSINQLRDKVSKAPVKHKGKLTLDGRGVACLLRNLVDAANSGDFPDVPSVWTAFLKTSSTEALFETVAVLEAQLKSLVETGVLPTPEFQKKSAELRRKCDDIFRQMTFGHEVPSETQTQFENQLQAKLEVYLQKNKDKIQEACSKQEGKQVDRFSEELSTLKLPIPSVELEKIAAQLKEAKLDAYCEALKDLSQELAFVDQLKNLETSLDHEIGRVENMNRREIGLMLERAVEEAEKFFVAALKALSEDDLKKARNMAIEESNAEFDRAAGFTADEQQSNGSRGILNTRYEKHYDAFYGANNMRVMQEVSSYATQLTNQLLDELDKVKLPRPTDDLVEEAKRREEVVMRELTDKYRKFQGLEGLNQKKEGIHKTFLQRLESMKKDNSHKIARQTEQVFKDARRLLAADAPKYYLQSSFEKDATQMVTSKLREMEFDPRLIKEATSMFVKEELPKISNFWPLWPVIAGVGIVIFSAIAFYFRRLVRWC